MQEKEKMTLYVTDHKGNTTVYQEGSDYSRGDLELRYKEAQQLPGYVARFK